MNLKQNGISLRKETLADETFLLKVYSSTRQEEMQLVNWTAAQKEAFLTMQINAQHRYYTDNYPGAQFHIILYDNQPVGRLYLHQRVKEIRIMDIALLPEYRNRGIGSVLLENILESGRELNLPVTIHVERLNPALNLYYRLGFRLREDKGVFLFLEWLPTGMEHQEHA